MVDFDNFDDLENPLHAVLDELEQLDEVNRRRRVHEEARNLVGLPHEVYIAWRDAFVDRGYVRFRDFEATYREERDRQQQAAREAAGGEEEGKEHSPSPATVLAQMALDNYVLGITSSEESYAVPKEGPRIPKMVARGPGQLLRPELKAQYYDERKAVPCSSALDDAVDMLDSLARRADPVDLHLRVAHHSGNVIIDMGDDSGRVVQIIPDDWQMLDATPGPLFQRTRVSKPLPEPARDGTLDDLRAAVNVTAESEPLIFAALVQDLIPDVSHPIVLLRGQQGAGKSTRARRIIDLIDPNTVPLRKPPKDADGWMVAAGASWAIAIDNISTIPEWLSDALCRAVTGDGDIRRALYTDGGLAVFDFRRTLLLTSIDVGSLAGDLADRLLAIECEPIGEEDRREDADLDAEWAQLYPRALGALYDLTSQVLAALPTTCPKRLPRMADYARVLAAVDAVLNTNGLDTYRAQAGDLAGEVLESSPIAAAIVKLVDTQPDRTWGSTPTELLDALKKAATDVEGTARRSAGWPTSPRALSAQLTRLEPSLKRVHKITVTHGRGGVRGRSRLVTLQGEPPEEAADFASAPSAPSATTSDQHENADASADANAGADFASAFASAPSTAPDLHEHPPADGAGGADAKSGAQSCGGRVHFARTRQAPRRAPRQITQCHRRRRRNLPRRVRS